MTSDYDQQESPFQLNRWKVLLYIGWFLAGIAGINLLGLFIAPVWQMVWALRIAAGILITAAWCKHGRDNPQYLLDLTQQTRVLLTAIGAVVQLGLLLAVWGSS